MTHPTLTPRQGWGRRGAPEAASPRRWQAVSNQIEKNEPTMTATMSEHDTLLEIAPDILPFRINVPEETRVALCQCLMATRWPDSETVRDRSQGPKLIACP